MAWKIHGGMVKACLWPDAGNGTIWLPADDEQDEILAIPGVDELSSECALPYKIIVEADSLDELPEVIERVSQAALEIIRKYAPERRKEAAVNNRVYGRSA
jgi:hypothetical protein